MKIRKYWEFVKWAVRSWSVSQWLWLVACFLFGASVSEKDPQVSLYMLGAGITILVGLFLRHVAFEILASAYQKFKKERTDLFKTIDEGR